MLLEGTIAELIVKPEPKLYRNYIWKNKQDNPMLYVKLKKASYGTFQAVLFFWKLLSNMLKKWGLRLNEYDQC